MSCSQIGTNLYQLKDGRFQIVTKGVITPLIVDCDFILVEKRLAEYLEQLDLPQVEIEEAIIYDPVSKNEITTHCQLKIGNHFSVDEIGDLKTDGECLLLMDNEYPFVSPELKKRLAASEFSYLRFSKGLSRFAA